MSPSFIDFIVQPVNLAFAAAALVTAAMLLWPTLGRGRGSSSRSVLEVTQLINSRNAVVFDVRDAEAFAKGSVTGARNMPSDMLAKRSGDLAKFKARPVIVVCQSGQRSAKSIAQLSADGFTEVYSLAGGIDAWREAGLPLVKDGTRAAPTALPGKESA